MAEGDVRVDLPNVRAGQPVSVEWHHPEALFVVSVEDDLDQDDDINGRRCRLGLSSNGDRPPLTVLPEILYEYVSLRREKLRSDAYVRYDISSFSPEDFAFRSASVDDRGCAIL